MQNFPECCLPGCDSVDKNEESFVAASGAAKGKESKPALLDRRPHAGTPEKARLLEFVKDFAKCAIRGSPCTLLSAEAEAEAGDKIPAAYFIDPQMRRLFVKRTQTPETLLANIRLENVKEVSEGASSDSALPKGLAPEDMQRLVVLDFVNDEPSLFLLEGHPTDRDRFVLCMKILRLYAQTFGRRLSPRPFE
mmetsp:Transcript_59478/g.123121  ORF Transcript_59478/g.123121 Transcript_59478/m.123121 type:complete len:193 (-) Transcript_59478:50-628(-)|eukprot:s4160_g2.t1